jgi:hypothetical protein
LYHASDFCSRETKYNVHVLSPKYRVKLGGEKKVANKSFEMWQIQTFEMTVTYQNYVSKEVKSRLNWGMLDTIQFRILYLLSLI